ncbi:hypothetical protein K491DRAFT_651059 [Lophiostoma macrostomum CBS 122681]|uniref:Rhodopsin domain-containing protein n=1 Tax=Lophiostoma macrostomum CBS 122681 TaxID=1314788 RepID=A0A6A6TKY0_9PLEO|nr:hypothetical protein K491DRAFT_651059 [Lophiostoma macrostomum CBS 122681]
MTEPSTGGHRWSNITADDHSGIVYITAFVTFTYTNLAFLTRCCLKWRVFGLDDWTMCITQAAFTAQFGILLASITAGLGRDFDILSFKRYSRMASYDYQIMFFISLGLSKCAAVMLVQRLFTRDTKDFWMTCNIVTGLMVIWTILSACLISVGCSPSSLAPQTPHQTCHGISTRYKVIVATDAMTDVCLVVIPAYLLWRLQMSVSSKLQVLSVFAFRLPLLALSALSITKFMESLRSSNPGVNRTPAIVYQQSQLCYSLIAATVPCLQSFIRSFDTGSGVKVKYTSNAYGSNRPGQGESYRMRSLSGHRSETRSRNYEDGNVKIYHRPFAHDGRAKGLNRGWGSSTAQVATIAYSTERPKEDDTVSNGSQELFIRRDVHWEVRTEDVPAAIEVAIS